MWEFSAYVAFNKATNGRTDKKHEKEKTNLAGMSLLKIPVEKLPPSHRSSLEMKASPSVLGLSRRLPSRGGAG